MSLTTLLTFISLLSFSASNLIPENDTAASPRITPTPTSPTPTSCTTTMFITPSRVCTWDGTETVHLQTLTSNYKVDCHGCQSVVVHSSDVPCPAEPTVATITTDAPATSWRTVCSESASPTDVTRVAAAAAAAPECVTTLTVNPPQAAGPISTKYLRTATETLRVGCEGCLLVVTTQVLGFGPPPTFTSTITAAVSTCTAYECKP